MAHNARMTLAEAFAQLRVLGFETPHDHVIETVLSRVCIRDDKVYKAYKHREADFADLTHQETRREYVREDFEWNQCMSPEVYLALHHVARDGEMYRHVGEGEAEDWYQEMKRVDTSYDLPRMLVSGRMTTQDVTLYVETLLTRLRELSRARRTKLEHIFARGNGHVHNEMLGTLAWASTVRTHLPSELMSRTERALREVIARSSYFRNPIALSVVIDVNSENILFLPEGVSFMDVMPPKDEWRVHDPLFLLARTSADMHAYGRGEYSSVLYETYARMHGEVPKEVALAYEIVALLIQVPYRVMVGDEDMASAYADVLASRVRELEDWFTQSDVDNIQTSR